jgi:hypothetical protein
MTFEIFLMGLLIVSTLTGLFTEAIKGWLQERGKKYYSNALAGYVAVGFSIAWICDTDRSGLQCKIGRVSDRLNAFVLAGRHGRL